MHRQLINPLVKLHEGADFMSPAQGGDSITRLEIAMASAELSPLFPNDYEL